LCAKGRATCSRPSNACVTAGERRVPTNITAYESKCRPELCRNCVRSPRNHRQIPAFAGSPREAFCGGKSLTRLREEVFQYHSVSVAGIVFQACSFNHSDISPSLESTTCERMTNGYRTRRDHSCSKLLTRANSATWNQPTPRVGGRLCKTFESRLNTYSDSRNESLRSRHWPSVPAGCAAERVADASCIESSAKCCAEMPPNLLLSRTAACGACDLALASYLC